MYRAVKVILTAELYKYRKSSGPRDTALWAASFSSLLVTDAIRHCTKELDNVEAWSFPRDAIEIVTPCG